MKSMLLLSIFFLACSFSHGQSSKTQPFEAVHSLYFIGGLNGGKYFFAEAGIAAHYLPADNDHPFYTFKALSVEVKMANAFMAGFKIGGWIRSPQDVILGLNGIYYTDFKNGSPVLRPEIGGGGDRFKIVGGYNVRLGRTGFDKINEFLLSAIYYFHLKDWK